ncbi:SpoVR family protein [Oceanobacillus sp. CAU 1775]
MIADKQLAYAIEEITEVAEGFGLDFYDMHYEICPASIIYTFGAYGMPTRFNHWSFGKQFHKMKLQYDLGLSQIYELVINSDPCYAFLLDTNSLIQNKLIVAHVLAHCDFFKNNIRFSNTRRDMVESMTQTAERISAYEMRYGKDEVEAFLDRVLAIQEHVDPSLTRKNPVETEEPPKKLSTKSTPYDDLWGIDDEDKKEAIRPKVRKKIPQQPEKDLLYFLEQYSRELDDWQRDIMTMLREEMLYFWPQLETKILNEGWASYWHQRIVRELDLTSDETIEYAKLNAGVLQPSRTSINPYHLGLKILEDIEEQHNNPTKEMINRGVKPGSGREKLFEVRALESDISLIRNYLTKDIILREDMYLFEKKGRDYRISTKDFNDVRDQLISMRINGGFPYITVVDGDYNRNGELYLLHGYEGIELDLPYLQHVLPYIYELWGRPVHIETQVEDRTVRFSYSGDEVKKKLLS